MVVFVKYIIKIFLRYVVVLSVFLMINSTTTLFQALSVTSHNIFLHRHIL